MAADAEGFLLDGGERVPAALKVWAAGIRASGRFDESGLELSRAGQIVVGSNLLAKGDQRIFALGDCASLIPEGAERSLPSTAQVANQQALHLVHHLPAWLRSGKPVPPFRFRDFGALIALSDYNAFGTLGRFRVLQRRLHQGPVRATEPCRALPTPPALAPRAVPGRAAVAGRADQRACAAQHPHELKRKRPCYYSADPVPEPGRDGELKIWKVDKRVDNVSNNNPELALPV